MLPDITEPIIEAVPGNSNKLLPTEPAPGKKSTFKTHRLSNQHYSERKTTERLKKLDIKKSGDFKQRY
jgi:hypothetical protein